MLWRSNKMTLQKVNMNRFFYEVITHKDVKVEPLYL